MGGGWIIAVMLEPRGERTATRQYFAVGHEDRARAEWAAVDYANALGSVATSPSGGAEPVHAERPLLASVVKNAGLKPGEVRPLGPRIPRRWLAAG